MSFAHRLDHKRCGRLDLQYSSFLMQNSSFLMQSSSFLMQNSSLSFSYRLLGFKSGRRACQNGFRNGCLKDEIGGAVCSGLQSGRELALAADGCPVCGDHSPPGFHLPYSPRARRQNLEVCIKFIMFNSKSIICDAQFIIFHANRYREVISHVQTVPMIRVPRQRNGCQRNGCLPIIHHLNAKTHRLNAELIILNANRRLPIIGLLSTWKNPHFQYKILIFSTKPIMFSTKPTIFSTNSTTFSTQFTSCSTKSTIFNMKSHPACGTESWRLCPPQPNASSRRVSACPRRSPRLRRADATQAYVFDIKS